MSEKHHVIAVLVENKPGVLARISSMFARRGFNIHSLAVGPTADPALSRITLVVDGPAMEQVIKQLYKLVPVVKVSEIPEDDRIERELMLLRVTSEPSRRHELLAAAEIFDAVPIDVGVATITFELTGTPSRLADFLELMTPYGVVDLVKSGRVALSRDVKTRDPKNTAPRTRETGRPRLRSA
ncbi:MAG: acetolactate synthase small subunit [Acidimicrobiia bacterium]